MYLNVGESMIIYHLNMTELMMYYTSVLVNTIY